jgi:hypothetical protein
VIDYVEKANAPIRNDMEILKTARSKWKSDDLI